LERYVFTRKWFALVLRALGCLLGLCLMLGGLPVAIAQYPTLRQIECDRIAPRSSLTHCAVVMQTLGGWRNYRKDYANVKRAKTLLVNSKITEYNDGSPTRTIDVQLFPLFLVDRAGIIERVDTITPYEPTSTTIANQLNQFFQSDQTKISINTMDISWDAKSDDLAGGRMHRSQRGYIGFSAFNVFMAFFGGAGTILKSLNFDSAEEPPE
jgi:hypothetical protein